MHPAARPAGARSRRPCIIRCRHAEAGSVPHGGRRRRATALKTSGSAWSCASRCARCARPRRTPPPPGHDPGDSVLLVRRHRYTGELSFYRYHSTAPAGLADLVAVVCTRWRTGEDIRAAKSLTGPGHGQVTCWNSWMRWSLISLIAALLAVALARTRSAHSPPATGLIPLTRPELLALLRAAVLRAPRRDLVHTLHWSHWRRRHQHRAATCHRRCNEITAAAI
jgi:hypothetical protein